MKVSGLGLESFCTRMQFSGSICWKDDLCSVARPLLLVRDHVPMLTWLDFWPIDDLCICHQMVITIKLINTAMASQVTF